MLTLCPALSCLKALYENMLVELPFAGFFLSKLLGTSADVDIHHLASLDPEVYRNLLFLKSYEEDMEELGLNFTVVNNNLGEAQVVELKLGGKDIPVTSANRIAYIHLVADYRLNKQIRPHCLAFRQGLANVISLEWLRMFDQQEIQVLISGAQVPISLEDLKSFMNYSGTFNLHCSNTGVLVRYLPVIPAPQETGAGGSQDPDQPVQLAGPCLSQKGLGLTIKAPLGSIPSTKKKDKTTECWTQCLAKASSCPLVPGLLCLFISSLRKFPFVSICCFFF
nr:ubiquitin-protein ligase E3C-like [Marmota flaviventris]